MILVSWFIFIGFLRYIPALRIFTSLLIQCVYDLGYFILFLGLFVISFCCTIHFEKHLKPIWSDTSEFDKIIEK